MTKRTGRPMGRPPLSMPDPIPDTPENVARALFSAPPTPEGGWDYLKEHKARQQERKRKAKRRKG